MHEIVTLQFGQRANYLATHFWNIQVGQHGARLGSPTSMTVIYFRLDRSLRKTSMTSVQLVFNLEKPSFSITSQTLTWLLTRIGIILHIRPQHNTKRSRP